MENSKQCPVCNYCDKKNNILEFLLQTLQLRTLEQNFIYMKVGFMRNGNNNTLIKSKAHTPKNSNGIVVECHQRFYKDNTEKLIRFHWKTR